MAKAAHLEFFAFFPSRFLGSEKVQFMTLEERGAFITMLCHAWENDGLPADMRRLAVLVGCTEEEITRMMAGDLGQCWEEVDGRLRNPRQEHERERAQELSDKRRKAAEARWSKKSTSNASADAHASQVHMQIDASADAHADDLQCNKTRQDKTRDLLRKSPPNPPTGGKPPKAARGKLTEEQLTMLADEFGLTPEARAAFAEWRVYRIELGKQLTQSGARKLAKRAQRDPAQFADDVDHSIDVGSQGLYARGKPKGDQFVSARVAAQRANHDSLVAFAANGQHAGSQTPSEGRSRISDDPMVILGLSEAPSEPVDVDSEDVA